MYIVNNKSKSKNGRKIYNSVLLRESYREDGKVKKRTIANLTGCPQKDIDAITLALKYKDDLSSLVSIKETLTFEQGLSFGSIHTVYQVAKELGIVKALGTSSPAKLALWQIISRVIEQGSRLSSVRLGRSYALPEVLDINSEFSEDDLYANLDWLDKNQAKIEDRLFFWRQKQEKDETEIFLYDVTSSYLEGDKNYFARFGYNRDKKKGKKQIVIGLLCGVNGIPLSVEVFNGNTKDTETFGSQVQKVADRFHCTNVTFVGDRGMIKIPQIGQLPGNFHYITAMTSSQIRTFIKRGVIQLELFDENLFEVEVDSIRYIMRRNPYRRDEIRENRKSKYESIEKFVAEKNKYLREYSRAKVEIAHRNIQTKIAKLRLKEWLQVKSKDRHLYLD